MANARLARFITEAAPPKFVSVMRQRTAKVMDTINEEERDDSLASLAKASSSLSSSSSSRSSSAGGSNYAFLKGMHRSFPIFDH